MSDFTPYPSSVSSSAAAENPGTILLGISTLLLAAGIVMVYSASVAQTSGLTNTFFPLARQLAWSSMSLAAMFLVSRIDYHRYGHPVIYRGALGVGLGVLVLVLVPGVGSKINGARRWIRLGHWVGVQPSELAKICVIVFVAGYLTHHHERVQEFAYGFAIPMILIILMFGLIVLEPDFGSAVLVATVATGMLVVGGIRLGPLVLLVLAGAPILYRMVFMVPYRMARLTAFLDPWRDAKGAGYHIIQSLIALGSGGTTGVGIGYSQQKLFFLPEANTDFVFAILGEELGFLGAGLVVLLFMLFVWEGMKVCRRAPDLLGFLLAFGVVFLIGLQAAVNIAVVTGTVPTKGLPLPFISAGGSSLLFTFVGMGILLNVASQRFGDRCESRFEPYSPREAAADI